MNMKRAGQALANKYEQEKLHNRKIVKRYR